MSEELTVGKIEQLNNTPERVIVGGKIEADMARLTTTARRIGGPLEDPRDAKIEKLRQALIKQNRELDQILGRALGYPRYCDDQKNFPGTTDADGVCTGEHVAETLAEEAATLIASLRAELEQERAKRCWRARWKAIAKYYRNQLQGLGYDTAEEEAE